MKKRRIDKSKLNLCIDIILLFLLMAMAGIGFLIKYVLLPGSERNQRYGSGVDLEFLGLTRHEWGTIHLVISIFFLVFIILHVILHWKMIVRIFKRMIPRKSLFVITASAIGAVSILLLILPLFVKPVVVERDHLQMNRGSRQGVQEQMRMNRKRTEKEIIETEVPESEKRLSPKNKRKQGKNKSKR